MPAPDPAPRGRHRRRDRRAAAEAIKAGLLPPPASARRWPAVSATGRRVLAAVVAVIVLAAVAVAIGVARHDDRARAVGAPRTATSGSSSPGPSSTPPTSPSSTSPSPTQPASSSSRVTPAPRRPTSAPPTLQVPVDPTATRSAPGVPVRVQVPSIGVDSKLEALGLLKNGRLEAPSHWQVAGYYAGGPRPGQVGPAVIAGHVDSVSGPAVFYRLRELKLGDKIYVTPRAGRRLTFEVTATGHYAKDKFPTQLVYGPTPLPELRLVTCTGEFDFKNHNYLDNLVVSAALAGTRLG